MAARKQVSPFLPFALLGTLVISLSLLVLSFRSPVQTNVKAAASACSQYQFSSMLSSSGTGNGQINSPYGLFVNSSYVFTAESLTQASMERIQRFNLSGTYSNLTFGSFGNSSGQFKSLKDVATDPSGNIYVTDSLNNRVQKFNAGGAYITQWAVTNPWAIAIDSAGNVYVGDNGTKRIKKYSSSGTLLSSWSGNPAFGTIAGLATNSTYVYATDFTNNNIQKFTVNGVFQAKWGTSGTATGQFSFPKGIAIDSGSYIYIADGNQRIQKFDANGAFITSWGSYGSLNGQFSSPSDVGVDPSGKVYVSDLGNNRVQIFTCVAPTPTPTPSYITYRQTTSGASLASYSVSTDSSVTAYPGQLYLATIATKADRGPIASVSGMNLNWIRLGGECSGRDQHRVDMYYAQATSSTVSGKVTATVSKLPKDMIIAVSRFSGQTPTAPVGNTAYANTLGVSGACSGGTDTSAYSFPLTPTTPGSLIFAGAGIRNRTHTPGSGYTERLEKHYGSGGDVVGLALETHGSVFPSTTVNGTLSGITDWTVFAVELK